MRRNSNRAIMKLVKHCLSPAWLRACFAVILFGAGTGRGASTTYTVDFSGIPDGTPLSQHDTFFGILHLSAGESAMSLGQTLYLTNEGFFNTGRLYSPAPWLPGDPVPGPVFFHSYIGASFSYPVSSVSFETQVIGPWGFSVDFSGVDQSGHPYNTVIEPDEGFQTLNYAAPEGGYLTGFSTRWDSDLGPAQFFIDNMSFGVEVPEPNAAGLLALGLACALILRWAPNSLRAEDKPISPKSSKDRAGISNNPCSKEV